MHALTVLEPWAWAIVDLSLLTPEAKNVENRGPTFPNITGPLLIHSGVGDRYRATYYEQQMFIWKRARLQGANGREVLAPPWEKIKGRGIIGFVEEVEVLDVATLRNIQGRGGSTAQRWHYNFDLAQRWAEGPTCVLLAGVVPLITPIPYRGQQGPFHVPDSLVADAIEEARERAAIREFGGG